MVGAAGIVTGALAGIFPEENASGIDDLLCQFVVVVSLYDQVFGSVSVRDKHCLFVVFHDNNPAVSQCLDCDVLSWQQLKLSFHFFLDLLCLVFRSSDKEHLGINAVFSL